MHDSSDLFLFDFSQGLFAEYIELLVQFGYLSLFSCVYPLVAVLLLINNLTEIRSDAYKICKLFRKPFSTPVANMGVWQVAFEVLSFVSVMSNCWLLLLSPQLQNFFQERRLSPTNALLLTVLVEVSFDSKVPSKTNHTCMFLCPFLTSAALSAARSDLGEVDFADTDSRRTGLDPQKEGAHRVHVHAGLEAAGLLSDLHILNLFNLFFEAEGTFFFVSS